MIRRLQRSIDFERVLRTRSRASSAHFAVHHVEGGPLPRPARAANPPAELSTGGAALEAAAVDDAPEAGAAPRPSAVWFGAVVPKRHARRSVTRTLLKRQIRSVVADGAQALASGLWVVRLRAPFDRGQFASAASEALRRQARSELQQVLASAVERLRRR